jgi:hypothetical protein
MGGAKNGCFSCTLPANSIIRTVDMASGYGLFKAKDRCGRLPPSQIRPKLTLSLRNSI